MRWFDTDLNEADKPAHPGRWAAYVEGTAPNGTPVRRSLTLYCRPPMFLLFFFPPEDLPAALPQKTSTILPEVWDEHRDELSEIETRDNGRILNDTRNLDLPACTEMWHYFAGAADKLHGDTVDIVDDVRGRLRIRLLGIDTPETKKRFEELNLLVAGGSTADMRKLIQEETKRWTEVIHKAGIQPE